MDHDGEPPLTLEPREPAPAPRRLGRKALLGGVAAACVLGLGLGLLARPQLITGGARPAPMQPAAQAPERQMDIVMADPAPEPRPPLDTLPPDLAPDLAGQPPPAPLPPPAPIARPAPQAPIAPEAPWAPEPPVALDSAWREPIRAERPSFDCRQAQSLAEEMVCADAVLAAADRHMARAYRRAEQSGAPYEQLRADQDAWLAYREEAALRSPRAVAIAYDRRIAELEAIAQGRRR
ncbi:lysozyme inhibitor LprI family protein [Phenylobacterium sp.]|uniref:lysozyme inhibitor LprI family protein n=1 Tax=Phenylobacterium sp. TaxID=1871053 RepID=UPI00289D6B83|nr:lysozyme inhibitor LprI family protein [Phenylobacterium sp.]